MTTWAATELCGAYRRAEAWSDAVELHRRMDAGLAGAFGGGDPRVARNRLNRAGVLVERGGDAAEARALVDACLEDVDPRHPVYREAMAVGDRLGELS